MLSEATISTAVDYFGFFLFDDIAADDCIMIFFGRGATKTFIVHLSPLDTWWLAFTTPFAITVSITIQFSLGKSSKY